jgi:hypothetical protein
MDLIIYGCWPASRGQRAHSQSREHDARGGAAESGCYETWSRSRGQTKLGLRRNEDTRCSGAR